MMAPASAPAIQATNPSLLIAQPHASAPEGAIPAASSQGPFIARRSSWPSLPGGEHPPLLPCCQWRIANIHICTPPFDTRGQHVHVAGWEPCFRHHPRPYGSPTMSFHVPSAWRRRISIALEFIATVSPDGSTTVPCQSLYSRAMSPTSTNLMTRPCNCAFLSIIPASMCRIPSLPTIVSPVFGTKLAFGSYSATAPSRSPALRCFPKRRGQSSGLREDIPGLLDLVQAAPGTTRSNPTGHARGLPIVARLPATNSRWSSTCFT